MRMSLFNFKNIETNESSRCLGACTATGMVTAYTFGGAHVDIIERCYLTRIYCPPKAGVLAMKTRILFVYLFNMGVESLRLLEGHGDECLRHGL